MKSFVRARTMTALLLAFCLLAAPITASAKKGEKNYKLGLEAERAQQWEKAAQEFALAVAANPSDTEYQLHYRRAIFNASQVYMQKGRALYEAGDYVGAYNAFRQAYGYDPVNELAASEMRRMLRLQREKEGLPADDEGGTNGTNGVNGAPRVTPSSFNSNNVGAQRPSTAALPTRSEPLRTINYSNQDLESVIRNLAEELNLNVVFDQSFAQTKRNITLRLKDVTAAQALDYIFLSYGLFFQKLSRRTILVADQSKRPQYQQLVLRTFYLSNVDPNDARNLIMTALPANAGRQPQVVVNKNTNSITVRDTPENVRIIGELLQTIDKDRVEVVMEVAIYEVSRQDLLQIGNQIGTADTLGNLGGIQTGSVLIGGGRRVIQGSGAAAATVPTALGAAILIPASTITALQSKDNTRLVFSTQVHAFDNEKSEVRIGAKVPVQTASVTPFGLSNPTPTTGTGTGVTGGASGVFGGGFPVIQYEDTGLSLDFTPKVYPGQDVEVKMVIETKDTSVTGSGAASALTPTFTQRRITGTARVPDNRTMMIASIAQDRQTDGRAGLPLLGLIPVLGRLFSTPRRNNVQSDIVITMTPRVLRAPQITPSDLEPLKSGSMQSPTSESLEALVQDADREDQLAAARQLPKSASVQLPNQEEAVTYVPAPKILAESAAASAQAANTAGAPTPTAASLKTAAPTAAQVVANIMGSALAPSPAANSLTSGAPAAPAVVTTATTTTTQSATAPVTQPAATTTTTAPAATPATMTKTTAPAPTQAELLLLPEQQEMRVGERRRLMLMLRTDAPIGLAAATLRFDPRLLAVRSVSQGTLGADKALAPVVTHTIDPSGVLVVSVAPAAGASPLTGAGLLLIIEVEGLGVGESVFNFDAGKVHLVASDGRAVQVKVNESRLKVAAAQ
ncbi:MAG TPA: secretin N-terminal domain-containing protein [Pyrinomonadaceae bacterium]|nr:secretin N-terminal domain-containing protein [Pyrinomonadaceae bacterium]